MPRRTVRPVVLVALVAMLAQAAFPAPAAAGLRGAHWAREKNPFTLKFGDNVDGTWDRYLRGGASEWNRSKVVNANVVGGKGGGNCRANRGQAEVCDGRYGDTGWLGLTQLLIQDKHIVAARVFMNDSYFDTNYYDDPDAKRHTMTHEMGHAYGLPHARGRAVMNDSGKAIFAYDQATGSDYKALEQLYRHTDGRTTVGTADLGADFTEADLSSPPPSAREVGGEEKIEDLGNGKTRVTIITPPDA